MCAKLHQDKSKRTDMDGSTPLVLLMENIYTLWGRRCLLRCVANSSPSAKLLSKALSLQVKSMAANS